MIQKREKIEIKTLATRTKIEMSKSTLVLSFLGTVLFMLLGFWMIIDSESFAMSKGSSPLIPIVIGILGVAFSGVCLVNILRLLFNRNAGLTIDQNGITDNSHSTSVGFIDWNDITGTKRVDIGVTRILLLFTDKPEKYISRAKTSRFRRVLEANNRKYGTPISIMSGTLEIKFGDLEKLILEKLETKDSRRFIRNEVPASYELDIGDEQRITSPEDSLK
ncbi:MAG: hypothetical protein M3405_15300 [Acidobacteriota bacterium]|jgi:hypothetical protein|nr:hypothetical protein [Acidobacteriota bacterium]